jgi:chromosome segregation ATPase
MTKRQESMEAMSQILQGNPQLWQVAGDLFVKNMDWPGAQEMAKRLQKTIDPKLLQDNDENPALEAANQQIQAMGQEMEQMHQMLQNVHKSIEAQEQQRKDYESEIKAYQAETQRISAVQAGMSEEQIQDIVAGTIAAAMHTGDLIGNMPEQQMPEFNEGEMPQQGMPPEQPPQEMMQ